MIHEKSHFIKHTSGRAGPGGFKCPCCWPQDKRARKQLFRMLKRAYRHKLKQHVQQELDE